jgi:hypothetical protein
MSSRLAFRMPEEVSYLQPASRKWDPLDLPDPGNDRPALHPVYRRAVAPVTPRGSWLARTFNSFWRTA